MNVHRLTTAGALPELPANTHLCNAIDTLAGAAALLEVAVLATRALSDEDAGNLEEPLRRVLLDLGDVDREIAAARAVLA